MGYHNYKNKSGGYYRGRSKTTGRYYTRQTRPKYSSESAGYIGPAIIIIVVIALAYLLFL